MNGNTEKIFGHDWEAIQRAQQGGQLNRPVVLKGNGKQPPTDADRALLEKHGSLEALESAGLYGVADRLRA